MPGCQHTQVHALHRFSVGLAAAFLLAAGGASAAPPPQGLEPARQLYNQGRYDEAIASAQRLRATPIGDAATLLIARARLELFRKSTDKAHLLAARQALGEIRPARLTPRDQTDYLVGLAEALYLDDSFGPAARLFESALARCEEAGTPTFDRVFDWWATSLDRQAQSGAGGSKEPFYEAIRDRAIIELGRMPGSTSAAYWLAASYRYLGDLTKAWDAAVAAWVGAPMADDQGRALRADIDQLVLQAILPERVRQMAPGDAERDRVANLLRAAWDGVKRDWANR